jgi:putative radical SAM enzyme (TIGR03279 family)
MTARDDASRDDGAAPGPPLHGSSAELPLFNSSDIAKERAQRSARPNPPSLEVQAVVRGSALERIGLRSGDRLLAVDRLVPRDVIDLQLELPAARCLVVERNGGERVELRCNTALDSAALALVEAVPGGIRECNNHCEFCFIRGLPAGLRRSLYVFDDDYRYSFLWGNFLTLTNLDERDWARIGYQRLSPLNVSVHATEPAVRQKLLNNRHAPPILPQLERLAGMGIQVNAQVVLCAGLNDGAVLDRTIEDLAELHPAVASLSVVPVGLTRYSRVKTIRRPTPAEAAAALEQCERQHAGMRGKLGNGFVYASDELYLLAGRDEVPGAAHYDGFPVPTNGIGLLRHMLDEWKRLLARLPTPSRASAREVAWVTGQLSAPALNRMADDWQASQGWRPRVVEVQNTYFGEGSISVSGLLSGADLIGALRSLPPQTDDIVLPAGPFGFDGRATLDGVSPEEVGAAHPGRVHLASTPRELLAIFSERETPLPLAEGGGEGCFPEGEAQLLTSG